MMAAATAMMAMMKMCDFFINARFVTSYAKRVS
jgi:hypothetical protein